MTGDGNRCYDGSCSMSVPDTTLRRYRKEWYERRHVLQTVYRKDGDMKTSAWQTDGKKASEIIREKIRQAGGQIEVISFNRKQRYDITATGDSFTCPKLPIAFGFEVFDVIVSLLQRLGGKAKKGSGRERVGHEKCSGDTVVGAIALEYLGEQEGEWACDPISVLAAVLDWAGIAANERGRIRLLP